MAPAAKHHGIEAEVYVITNRDRRRLAVAPGMCRRENVGD
jgi:hypothetical protein